jgi:hypothetical protein
MEKWMYNTELENHLIQHFSTTSEPWEQERDNVNVHRLEEFVHGYINQRSSYVNPGQEQLMDDFLRIAKLDIDGQFEYNPDDCLRVIEAIETFGL